MDGTPITVTDNGNLAIFYNYDNIKNSGRIVLRNTGPNRLPDVPCSAITITSKAGNDYIWLAGFGDDDPAIGLGIPIYEDHPVTMPCINANYFSLFPENDGDEVYLTIYGFGNADIVRGDPAPLDKIPPTILSSSPSAGAVNVERNSTITMTANKSLAPTSVTLTTVTLSPSVVDMSVSLDATNAAKIVITNVNQMAASTLYTVTATTGITNVYGYAMTAPFSFTFTTKALPPPPDTTPPTVSSTNPANNATGVLPTITPTVTFSEAMLLSSFTSNVKAYLTSNNIEIPGLTFALSVDNLTLTVQGLTLAESTGYRIDVGTGVTDLAGNHLASLYSISFTTGVNSVTVYSVSGNAYDNLYTAGFLGSSLQKTTIKVVNTSSLLYNRKPIKYIPVLKKTGSPSGTVSLLWLNSAGSTKKTLGTIATSSIGTTDTAITISDATNTSAFAVGDLIAVVYTGGDSSNYVSVKISNIQAFDGTNTINSKYTTGFFGSGYTDYTTSDLAMTIDVLP